MAERKLYNQQSPGLNSGSARTASLTKRGSRPCCSVTIHFSVIMAFLAGLLSGRGRVGWKRIDHKVKSEFSRRWRYPEFYLPTGVSCTSNTKDHFTLVAY